MSDINEVPLEIIRLFESYTLQAIASGVHRCSARAVMNRVRWYLRIEKRDQLMECDNNWIKALLRNFVAKYPKYSSIFITQRKSRRKNGKADRCNSRAP
jgi:hypothetical protein